MKSGLTGYKSPNLPRRYSHSIILSDSSLFSNRKRTNDIPTIENTREPATMPVPYKTTPPQSISTVDVAYSTAAQAFLRRDSTATHKALTHLLDLLRLLPPPRPWTDFSKHPSTAKTTPDETLVKSLKLYISAEATLATSPSLPLLESLHSTCLSFFSASLPPALVSTLLLASLKIPDAVGLDFAHRLAEDWLTELPDDVVRSLNLETGDRRRVEVAKEGYLRVVEVFVGEVLVREGEWGMARALLDGEVVMGSKRKEVSWVGTTCVLPLLRRPHSDSVALRTALLLEG